MAMPRIHYFIPYENKIPCGGFSTRGGGRSKNVIADEASMRLLGKTTPAKNNNNEDVNFKRALLMNLEDYIRIKNAIISAPQENQDFYDIRFGVMDLELYKKFMFQIMKLRDSDGGDGGLEAYLSLLKKFFPELFGGESLDEYDVFNLYANPLGLKCVPSEEGVEDANGALKNLIMNYYFPDMDAPMLLDDLLDDIGIFVWEYDFTTVDGIHNAFILPNERQMSLFFLSERDEEYPVHKNVIKYYSGK